MLIFIMRTFPGIYEKYRVSRKKALKEMLEEYKLKKLMELVVSCAVFVYVLHNFGGWKK